MSWGGKCSLFQPILKGWHIRAPEPRIVQGPRPGTGDYQDWHRAAQAWGLHQKGPSQPQEQGIQISVIHTGFKYLPG